jgi:hypothetical protein
MGNSVRRPYLRPSQTMHNIMISLLFSVEWQVVESGCHLFFLDKKIAAILRGIAAIFLIKSVIEIPLNSLILNSL